MVKETLGENFLGTVSQILIEMIVLGEQKGGVQRVPNTNVRSGLKMPIEFEYYIIIYHHRKLI